MWSHLLYVWGKALLNGDFGIQLFTVRTVTHLCSLLHCRMKSWSHSSPLQTQKLTLLTLKPSPLSLTSFFPTSTSTLLSPRRSLTLLSPSSSSGRSVELVPSDLWWAAADVHGAGSGRVCARHSGQHAVHGAHRTVHGRGQTAVHSPDSGQQALLFPR